jgi:N-terminal acetyltransferase B complex catalytic subunit
VVIVLCLSLEFNSNHTGVSYLLVHVVMGKVEGEEAKKEWHGHVTAVTVAPECRKQGLAKLLMNYLERISERHNAFFVDLFVRASNTVAI